MKQLKDKLAMSRQSIDQEVVDHTNLVIEKQTLTSNQQELKAQLEQLSLKK